MKEQNSDVIIVGSGVAGLFCALNLPSTKNITLITKQKLEDCDSYLAQGGICVLKDKDDYESYFEDTLKAGHYENDKKAVETMILSSQGIIQELIKYGVEFEKSNGELAYTKEGAHSKPRILFHEDVTGKEITRKLLANVKKLKNVKLIENCMMLDVIEKDNVCYGVVAKENDEIKAFKAPVVIMATGGIGGIFENSTNYRHLTGDAIAIALKHNIKLKNINYIQIHPTTLYSKKTGRKFLISESVRGEGAILLNKEGKRFADELMPRDILTKEILKQMEIDNTPYEWLSLENVSEDTIKNHFPNIYEKCLEDGYDITKEPIPVVPAQHYFMGGIEVDLDGKTSMKNLYAVGETCCNGVHGHNRLASNSLLESLVWAKRAALSVSRGQVP